MDYWWNGIALYHSSGKCEHLWHQTSIFLIRIDSTFHHSAYLSTTLNICLPWYHHHFASSQRFSSVRNVNIDANLANRDTEETWHGCSKSPIDSSISDKNVVLKIVPKYLKIISTNVTGRDQVNFSIPLSLSLSAFSLPFFLSSTGNTNRIHTGEERNRRTRESRFLKELFYRPTLR